MSYARRGKSKLAVFVISYCVKATNDEKENRTTTKTVIKPT